MSRTVTIPVTTRQAEFLEDMVQSGSESAMAAWDAGARVDRLTLVVPPAAARHLGLAVGMRADIADEGEYSLGERSSILGLAGKLAKAGISSAAPLIVTD